MIELRLSVRENCAELCELAYLGVPDFSKDGIEMFFVDDDEYDKENYYVVLAGSNQRMDWITNLIFFAVTYKGTKYHRGYFKKIFPHLEEIISRIQTNKTLIITGHSKGGAEAIIIACLTNIPFAQIVTFGSPKAVKSGASKIIKMLGDKLTSYENTYDLITKLPPHWVKYGKRVVRSIRIKGKSEHPMTVYRVKFFQ